MKKLMLALSIVGLMIAVRGVPFSEAKVTGKVVEYTARGVTMKSYLTYDEDIKEKRPGVLVVPEWWGLNAYARKRAEMLAELGYTALAVDMYGEGKQAANPDEAGKLSSEIMKNIDGAVARFTASMSFLKEQPTVDPTRIAAIGYCFGGGVVLNMAGQGLDLKGVVSFHGGLDLAKPPVAGGVKARALVLTGGDDKFVPPQQVEQFTKRMKGAGADLQIISYPGAKHSFTNPEADALGKKFNMPIAYNAEANKKSWDEMKRFLVEIFKK